ncbi:MAG: ATP-grasp domain-containing protein [Candidatus Saccharimonadales bacterium]
MKLLEHEAKTILRAGSIATPNSMLITNTFTPDLSLPVVLKSQIPIGGRGKLGGIVIVDDQADITPTIDRLFALDIRGYKPSTILAEQKLAIVNEYYFSLLINRQTAIIELAAHTNGGVEVESNETGSFLQVILDGKNFNTAGEQLTEYLDLPSQTFALQDLIERSYHCFVKNDAVLLEINPLVLTADDKLVAGDCKMELDDAAAFRHPEWAFEDTANDTNFVTLDDTGTVATIANGAGLAMATVDAVATAGMTPANFLDIGGGANTASVLAAFERIMTFNHIQAIVINIFAGITKCDEVARAIIDARQQMADLPPLFIRLAGTNFEQAVTLLSAEGITTLATLDQCLDAAKEAHDA